MIAAKYTNTRDRGSNPKVKIIYPKKNERHVRHANGNRIFLISEAALIIDTPRATKNDERILVDARRE